MEKLAKTARCTCTKMNIFRLSTIHCSSTSTSCRLNVSVRRTLLTVTFITEVETRIILSTASPVANGRFPHSSNCKCGLQQLKEQSECKQIPLQKVLYAIQVFC